MDLLRHSHKNDNFVIINDYSLETGAVTCPVAPLSHCFEIICHDWNVGLADHLMRSFYK